MNLLKAQQLWIIVGFVFLILTLNRLRSAPFKGAAIEMPPALPGDSYCLRNHEQTKLNYLSEKLGVLYFTKSHFLELRKIGLYPVLGPLYIPLK